MPKVRTLKAFSGVPVNTTGNAVRDGKHWKVTWDLPRSRPLVDWFDNEEYDQYLTIIE